jgi:hypothetical protein
MAVAHRIIIWVFAVLHNLTRAIPNNEEQLTDPTRYLRRLENGPLEKREMHSQSGYASFMTSAKPAIPTQKVLRPCISLPTSMHVPGTLQLE